MTDHSSLEALAQRHGEAEYGRMIAQAYSVLGHLHARHREVVDYLRLTLDEDPDDYFVRLTAQPHDHPGDRPCLRCALSPECMSGLEASLIELGMLRNGTDRDTVHPSAAKAVARVRASHPTEQVLAQTFGPYWFDVLALPLELVHSHSGGRAALMADVGQTTLWVGDGRDHRLAADWVSESTMRSLVRRRGGLPLTGGVPRDRVLKLSHHLWLRSKGLLIGTGRIDQIVAQQAQVAAPRELRMAV